MINGINPAQQQAADALANHILQLLGQHVERGHVTAHLAAQLAAGVFCHAAAIAEMDWAECGPQLERRLAKAIEAVAEFKARMAAEQEAKPSIILTDN